MGVFRELLRGSDLELKPVSAELVFDGSRIVFSYQAETRPDLSALQEKLRGRLDRRVELRSVGPRECARPAATTASAATSTAAANSRRTSSRSPCGWRRTRSCR